MKTMLRLLVVVVLLGLAACQAPAAPTPTRTPDDAALKTLPATGLPTVEPKPLPSSTPAAAFTATPVPSPTIPPPTVSCAAFPGWPGCRAGGKLPLTGQLAWVDATSGILTAANFNSGEAWNLPAAGATRLAWSLDKAQLLVLDKDGGSIYPAKGGAPARAVEKNPQDWLPGGLLLPAGWAGNASGATAHIEVLEQRPMVKIRPGGFSSVETSFPLATGPTDRLFRLLAWLPGTDLVLGQAHYAANSMWVTGGQLFTLDAKSGAVKWLEAYTPIGAAVAPHPGQPGLLALVESGAGGQRLAVLEALTGKLTLLTTDDSVWVSRPTWTPDGKALLFAAWAMPLEGPSGAPFDLRAIYLTSPTGGPLVRLTQPTAGLMDDQPRVLAGGKHFLYLRRALDGKNAELRLGGLEGTYDEAMVKGVLAPTCQPQPGCLRAVWDYIE